MERKNIKRTAWTGWAARVSGTLLAVIWIYIVIIKAVNEAGEPVVWQSYVMLGSVIILISGVILGWFRDKAGGFILVSAGLAFSIWSYFEAGRNEWLAFLVSGFPYFLAGVLFLISSLFSRKKK